MLSIGRCRGDSPARMRKRSTGTRGSRPSSRIRRRDQGRRRQTPYGIRRPGAGTGGQGHQGNPVSVAALRGKVVVVHYWATWSVPCRQDISVLKDMQTKYGKDNVGVLGVNVDNSEEDFQAISSGNPIPWPQMHEPGGLDSPLATTLGVHDPADHAAARQGRQSGQPQPARRGRRRVAAKLAAVSAGGSAPETLS